jgi:ABC-type transport system involved in multi-copper enzyme maturation permease subunit
MEAPMFLSGGPSFLWPLHCGIMAAASAGVLAACVLLVRRVGLRQATGDTGVFSRPARAPVAASAAAPVAPPAGGAAAPAPPVVYAPPAPAGKIRRINGSPVLWRELRQPLTRSVVKRVLGVVIPVVLLATLYAFFAGYEMLEEVDTHVFFVCLYLIAGILVTVVLAATSITTEKETGSWPLLLATTIAARHIVLAKAAGVLRRSLPVWAFLAAHVVAFSVVGYVHPVAIFLVALVAGWTAIFLTGLGLWLSALLRRSTTAVITALGAVLVLWLLLPLLLELTSHIDFDDYEVRRTLDDAAQAVAAANPVRQAAVLMGGTAGTFQAEESLRALDFNWPDPYGYLDAGECALAVIGHAYGYGIVAVLLSAAAGRRVRRRIYPG